MDWHAPPRLDDPRTVERIRGQFRIRRAPLLLQGGLTLALGAGVFWTLLNAIPPVARRGAGFLLALLLALGLPALATLSLLQRSRLLRAYQKTPEQWREWRVERVTFTGWGTRLSVGRTQKVERLRWRSADGMRHGLTEPAPVKLTARLAKGDAIYVAFPPGGGAAPLYLGRAA